MIELRKTAETVSSVTLSWDPVPGAVGYRFTREGEPKPSHTWDGARTSVKFAKGAEWYAVEALGVEDKGVWPPPPPGIAQPQPPFQTRSSALLVRTPGAGLTEHVHLTSAPDFGILVMQWPPAEWPSRYTVRDCIAENVVLPPFDLEGFNEATLWLGQSVHAHRLLARNAEWMGMFTGSRFADSVVEDFQLLQMPWVGLYPEHVSCDSTFRRFNIECRKNGINVEWWYPSAEHGPFAAQRLGSAVTGGRAGSWGLKFYDGRIRSTDGYCMYLDAGTFGCEIAVDGYLDLDGPSGIRLPRRLIDPNRPNVVKAENINWNSIPEDRRITYHDDPIGTFVAPRLAAGLGLGRIEGHMPHRRIRDWARVAELIDAAA